MKYSQQKSASVGGRVAALQSNFTVNDTPIDKLLPLLNKVKQTGSGKWQACCPAHADKNPSLSIKEAEDGTLLLKCWSGCSAAAVINAVGLEMRDLFPPMMRRDFDPTQRKKPAGWRMADAFGSLVTESFILGLALERLLHGLPLSPDDKIRALEAVGRIECIHTEVQRYG